MITVKESKKEKLMKKFLIQVMKRNLILTKMMIPFLLIQKINKTIRMIRKKATVDLAISK